MAGIKGRRGRPRLNNLVLTEHQQVNDSTRFNMDVKQRMPIKKVSEVPRVSNQEEQATLARIPKATFTVREATNESNNEEQTLEQPDRHYERPNHYIRHNGPSDEDLNRTIEYDMDEQDNIWLQLYNKEREKDFLGEITESLFEEIMDKLEKEWYNLIKRAPREDTIVTTDDSACAVCDDTEVENSNVMVFCDGCNVAVHQECYGIPHVPEGGWLCTKCSILPHQPVSCLFCPNPGGAFKKTDTDQWGHLLCAIWIPEIGVGDTHLMEPIDMIDRVPKKRWELKCYICDIREGACIQCDCKTCCTAFHVTCAKAAKLCMTMNAHSTEGVVLKAYCDKHTPKEYDRIVSVPATTGRGRGRKVNHTNTNQEELNTDKESRTVQPQCSKNVPVLHDSIMVAIDNMDCIRNSNIRKRNDVVTAITHYWALKRESRKGAPLLKRLQLESWGTSFKEDREALAQRKAFLSMLRADIDRLRILTTEAQTRERLKVESTKLQKSYIDTIRYPVEQVIRPIFHSFTVIDKKSLFVNPLEDHQSMCFNKIISKLNTHEYTHLDQFKQDISLIWTHVIQSDKYQPSHLKTALKLQAESTKLFAKADQEMSRYDLAGEIMNVPLDESMFIYSREVEEEEVVPVKEKRIEVLEHAPSAPSSKRGRGRGRGKRKASPFNPRAQGRWIKAKAEKENTPLENHEMDTSTAQDAAVEKLALEEPTAEEQMMQIRMIQPAIIEENTSVNTSQPSSEVAMSTKDAPVEVEYSLEKEVVTDQPVDKTTFTKEETLLKLTSPSTVKDESTVVGTRQGAKVIHPQQDALSPNSLFVDTTADQHLVKEVHPVEPLVVESKQKDQQLPQETTAVQSLPVIDVAPELLSKELELSENKVITTDIPEIQTPPVLQPFTTGNPIVKENTVSLAPVMQSADECNVRSMETDAKTFFEMKRRQEAERKRLRELSQKATLQKEGSIPPQADVSTKQAVHSTDTLINPITTANHQTTPMEINDRQSSSTVTKTTPVPSSSKKLDAKSTTLTPRKTRSAGLSASVEEIKQRPVLKGEAKVLVSSYNGISHFDGPRTDVYTENKRKRAPLGWVYVLDNDDDEQKEQDNALETVETVKKPKKKPPRNAIDVPKYNYNQLVWAKVDRFPSHPAKFSNKPDDECPSNILATRSHKGDILVEFIGIKETDQWGWVARENIHPIGDPEKDKLHLNETLTNAMAKRNPDRFIRDIKSGYRGAGEVLGFDAEPLLEAIFNKPKTPKKRKLSKKKY